MVTESRPVGSYLVNRAELPLLRSSLASMGVREHQFPEDRVDIAYFDNGPHQLPFGWNIRAKKHSCSAPGENFQFFSGREWELQLKDVPKTSNALLKFAQGRFSFFEIIALIGSQTDINGMPLSAPLVPFVVNSYYHEVYRIGGDTRFKISVDDMTMHYAFMVISMAKRIGQEDFVRVEMNTAYKHNEYNADASMTFKKLLDSVAAVPVVSKKGAAYNSLCSYLMRQSGWQPGQTDTEIEAKLSLEASQQYLFNLIKNDFAHGRVNGFALAERFPHTLESAKISTYLPDKSNGYIRVSAQGNERVVTIKEGKEMMSDPYNLGCIVKRREIESISASDMESKEGISLYKQTKKFWVASMEGNVYCISIEGCFSLDGRRGSLYQMEIERTMMHPSKEQEVDAARDIASITKQLTDMHFGLVPTTQTKQEWLMAFSRK